MLYTKLFPNFMLIPNRVSRFARDPRKTVADVDELNKWVEVFFHCNILLFNEVQAFTSYKSKLILLPALLEAGGVKCLYEHLTEGTANSNHGSHRIYQQHSMRDGGYVTRHVSSEFSDPWQSYMNGIELGLKEQKVSIEQLTEMTGGYMLVGKTFFETYLQIVTTPIPTAVLAIGRTHLPLRGMSFEMIGNFTKVNGKPAMNSVTGPRLKNLVTQMGGSLIEGRFANMCESFNKLQQCYVVLQDDEYLRIYIEGDYMRQNKVSGNLVQSTRGDFNYIKADFLIQCHISGCLLDPAPFPIEVDHSKFVKNRRTNITKFMERQRSIVDAVPITTTILGTTSVRLRRRPRYATTSTASRHQRLAEQCRRRRHALAQLRLAKSESSTRRKEYIRFTKQIHQRSAHFSPVNSQTFQRALSAAWAAERR